uniref:Phosphofurin acidic cluster sorting protein 2-like n=1 Tax=Phallusia mammillata TaxID=59560 RepID=A0A6F9DP00_9ASCI|nr:phosphofurin acidic cluster sorting protein 2-like [Phallusia mammillata]
MNRGGGSSGQASIPMNFFATWEIDRSSSNCIPRICSMSICRLTVIRELDKDVQSVFIAVKMQGSKRVFRSNEIFLGSGGMTNTVLELTFSLQYPHFIKRDENRLQLLLQRRKRYKNRAMLGYKTLAVGRVGMGQIIQCPIVEESTIDMYAPSKENHDLILVAQINVLNMSSIPIDADMESDQRTKHLGTDRSPDVENYSDDEEDELTYSSDQDLGSDNPQFEPHNSKRKNRRKVRMSSSSRQQNFIKSKVAALLKKFKQVADEGLEPDMVPDTDHNPTDPVDYDFLYDEIEDFNLSDSCPEIDDNSSIVSTPKPKLRPFFDRISHSSSQTEISSLRDQPTIDQCATHNPVSGGHHDPAEEMDTETTFTTNHPPATSLSKSWDDPPVIKMLESEPKRALSSSADAPTCVSSASNSPKSRHASRDESPWNPTSSFRDKVSNKETVNSSMHSSLPETLQALEEGIPDALCIVDGADRYGSHVMNLLKQHTTYFPILVQNPLGVQSVFACIIGLLQKYMNSNSQSHKPIRVAVFGGEVFLNNVLRQYVEQLSSRPPDWQSLFTFYVLPLGPNRVARYIASIDARYASLFSDSNWRECIEKFIDNGDQTNKPSHDYACMTSRITDYLTDAGHTLSLSVAEAMLTLRQKSGDEDCTQTFLPFISDVKVGENELFTVADSDKEDFQQSSNAQTSQAPQLATVSIISPPSSPSVPAPLTSQNSSVSSSSYSSAASAPETKLGLQVDYWKERDVSKYSLKTNFKSFHVSRLPTPGESVTSSTGLALEVVTKGKKMIMRLPGKKGKEKESESKSQVVGNISRLLCSSKHQHSLLKVKIDGVEWRDIKFFQLSSHWSSHAKLFPVAVFSNGSV